MRLFQIFFFIIFAVNFKIYSQSFEISVLPFQDTVLTGNSAAFNISVTPTGGFTASVYFSVSASTLTNTTFSFNPSPINYPYSGGVNLAVNPGASTPTGNHEIIVTGYNGPVYSYDTVYLFVKTSVEWIVYDKSNSGLSDNDVHKIAIEQDSIIWIGATSGVTRFDGNNWTVYNAFNSGLPTSTVYELIVDKFNNKWIAPEGNGLVKFDDSIWTVYNTSNSLLPDNGVLSLASDTIGNIWIGTWYGLAKFDGTFWTVYNTSNSDLPDNRIRSIAIDKLNNKWIGYATYSGGIVKFDGDTTWTLYQSFPGCCSGYYFPISIDGNNGIWLGAVGLTFFDGSSYWMNYITSNSGLPDNYVTSISIDADNKLWIGTLSEGMSMFDGNSTWITYNTTNSVIPVDNISSIAIDKFNNKWIGTNGGGLVVYNQAGIVLSNNDLFKNTKSPKSPVLFPNYPNPYTRTTKFSYYLPSESYVSLKIFDISGKLVTTIFDERKSQGKHSFFYDFHKLNEGLYFYQLSSDNFIATKKMILMNR